MYSTTRAVSSLMYGVMMATRPAPRAWMPLSSAPALETTGASAPSARRAAVISASATQ